MGAGEIGDVHGEMMAVVLRISSLVSRKIKHCVGPTFTLVTATFISWVKVYGALHDLFVELADARCVPCGTRNSTYGMPRVINAELRPRRMHTEMVAPRAGHVDMAILGLAGEFSAV